MITIYATQEVSISYYPTTRCGLRLWAVAVNKWCIATHMSEGGARAHAERLVKKLSV